MLYAVWSRLLSVACQCRSSLSTKTHRCVRILRSMAYKNEVSLQCVPLCIIYAFWRKSSELLQGYPSVSLQHTHNSILPVSFKFRHFLVVVHVYRSDGTPAVGKQLQPPLEHRPIAQVYSVQVYRHAITHCTSPVCMTVLMLPAGCGKTRSTFQSNWTRLGSLSVPRWWMLAWLR